MAKSKIDQTCIITEVVSNPKKGASALRFALYEPGMTVKAYHDAVAAQLGKAEGSKALPDINWDGARGLIKLQTASGEPVLFDPPVKKTKKAPAEAPSEPTAEPTAEATEPQAATA
jgi:hypothetical protein